MDFSLNLPINSVSFGQVCVSLLREMHKRDMQPCLFPFGGTVDLSSQEPDKDFSSWLDSCIKKSLKEHINLIKDAMFSSSNEPGGTSYRHRFEDPKFTFAGKTGSSQIKRFTEAQREAEVKQESLPYKDRDHALFVAFAPYKNPEYAISVLVEHGGSGGKAAAPIAKKVIKKVLERHELRRSTNNQKGEAI